MTQCWNIAWTKNIINNVIPLVYTYYYMFCRSIHVGFKAYFLFDYIWHSVQFTKKSSSYKHFLLKYKEKTGLTNVYKHKHLKDNFTHVFVNAVTYSMGVIIYIWKFYNKLQHIFIWLFRPNRRLRLFIGMTKFFHFCKGHNAYLSIDFKL